MGRNSLKLLIEIIRCHENRRNIYVTYVNIGRDDLFRATVILYNTILYVLFEKCSIFLRETFNRELFHNFHI